MGNLGGGNMRPRDYGFQERMVMSEGIAVNSNVTTILLSAIPGATLVEKAQNMDDKRGIDYWVFRHDARPLAIDLKARSTDPTVDLPVPCDDLALERWSVIEQQKIGWTLDQSKETDYILWLFETTGRWVLLPFPMLCAVFAQHMIGWGQQYKSATQSSNGGRWHSQCIFVPRLVVWRAMYEMYGGAPPTKRGHRDH